MSQVSSLISRVAVLGAGFALGMAASARKAREGEGLAPVRQALNDLGSNIDAKISLQAGRIQQLEKRVDEQETKWEHAPSLDQILTAMEELLSNRMDGLERKLTVQVHSVEMLRTTISRTDELLERLTESVESLRNPEWDDRQKHGAAVGLPA